tara:strand:+ start:462 stop:785 length:324 start_codon:yes stop_codon:yes gene_type:complete
MRQIETLWQTYDFILDKIVGLEDNISYLLDKDIAITDKTFDKKLRELINAYNKQLLTIREIKSFCKNNSEEIPEDRQVALDTLEELEEVTEQLKLEMSLNIKNRPKD